MKLVIQQAHCFVLAGSLIFGAAALTGCGESGDGPDNADNASTDGTAAGGSAGPNAGGTASVTIDHGSPESLFDSLMQASAAEDNAAVMSAFTPSDQLDMAAGMVAMVPTAGMMPGSDKPGMLAVLKEYGIEESQLPGMGPQMQDQATDLAQGIEDKPAFIAAMMETLPQMPGNPGVSNMFTGTAAGSLSLTDLTITGDTANAKVTAAGQSSEEERRVSFVKVDGKWYLGQGE